MRRKKKQNKILNGKNFLGLLIIVIMVSSGVGFMMGNDSGQGSETYGDNVFNSKDGRWYTKYQGQELEFNYFPAHVDNIEFPTDGSLDLKNAEAFVIVFDPDDEAIQYIEQVRFEMQRDFSQKLGKFVGVGMTGNSSLYTFPIITCANASSTVPVVYMHSTNKTGFEYSNGCLMMQADSPAQFLQLKDRFVYELTEIIE